jgi:hypothetical protein
VCGANKGANTGRIGFKQKIRGSLDFEKLQLSRINSNEDQKGTTK